ncbi:MAG: hypothetical protein ACREMA_17140, partial [Longimicrobiales bacterium]
VALGGPVRKDRVFFFGTYERNEQRGVFASRLLAPEFAHLSRITPSPSFGNQFSLRTDFRLREKHYGFARHSHDGIAAFGPASLTMAGARAYPSNWTRQPLWADQSVLGLTSVLAANELRFSYFFVSSAEQAARESDCPGCVGIGAPSITVQNVDLFIGKNISNSVLARRYHLSDTLAWQKGPHRIRFGGEWEYTRGGRIDDVDLVTMTLFAPQSVINYNALPETPAELRISLPGSYLTTADILQLPVRSFILGIGESRIPQKDFGDTRTGQVAHLFLQDTWRLHPKLTFNYGLGWTYDEALNYDLRKPAYLAPLLGPDGLGPTRKNWTNFSPLAGLAWSPGQDGKTVIRAGGGIYYEFLVPVTTADAERTALSPHGVGARTYDSGGIPNPIGLLG